MNKAGLNHTMSMNDVYSLEQGRMVFKISTAKSDMKNVWLYYVDKFLKIHGLTEMDHTLMTKIGTTGEKDYFETIIDVDVISLRYFFKVEDYDGNICYYCDKDIYDEEPKDPVTMFDVPQQAREEEIFDIPLWMKEGIVYQVFPDRFYRGNDFIEHKKDVKYGSWDKAVKWDSILGGSLKGVTEKLGYLEELGVTIIYLNPIFMSPSNHKYDTTDYFEIDPSFGNKEDFKELIERAHSKKMKIVIDGVFNHCGFQFFAFQDVVKKEKESRYKDWFHIYSFPIDTGYRKGRRNEKPSYDTFGYHSGMPKLNMGNSKVREYIFKLTDYWTREFNIDGWRLDASDEISFDFWKAFRKHIKDINPEIGIIGEIWYDATNWLLGDQYDSVMNYKFRTPIVDFIAENSISASTFNNHLQFTRARYKRPTQLGLWNLIDSHDTPRFLTLCQEDIRKLRLAITLQFTLQGSPVIYYGDEIGMIGNQDPDCRRGMIWDKDRQNAKLLEFYKHLIKLRKANPVLVYGEYKMIYIDDELSLLIYSRYTESDEIIVVINNSDTEVDINKLETYRIWSDDRKIISLVGNKDSDSMMRDDVFNNGIIKAYTSVIFRAE